MKKLLACMILAILCSSVAHAAWSPFVIRENDPAGVPLILPNDDYVAGATEFVVFAGSQKAGWGIDLPDGATIGDLASISIDRLDDYTRFAAGSGPAVAPYFNIWVTDGNDNYAVIANEPSNAEWQPGNQQWNMTWSTLSTKVAKSYENTDMSWITSLDTGGDGLTFSDVAGLEIKAPSVVELNTGWSGLSTGAPRELGTNVAYDFTWVFGDTLSNYVSGAEGFVVANPAVNVVPEPASAIALLLLAVGSLGFFRGNRR